MEENDTKEYEVGYKRPPRHTRFKRGQSGNPKGRPRIGKQIASILKKALHQKVIVNEQGRQRKISMLEAIFAQLVTKAARGDHRAMQLLMLYQLPELEKYTPSTPEPEMPDEAVNLFAASVDFLIRSGAVPPTLLRILREEQSRKPTNASESACDRQTLAWLPPSTPATIVRGKGVEIYKPEDDPPF